MANNDYITTDCKLTVSKNTAKLDEEIFLYKNDRNIKLLIEIVDNKYRYKSDDLSNLLVKYKASYAQVKWYKNAEVKKEFPIQATDDGKVVFVIEGQLIDEDTELGDYDLQLRLLNESQESIRSLPIIKGAVHILKPLFEEGDIATVNSAVADVSMLSLDGDAIDTYNSDGTYNQTNWGNGDVISSAKLNKLEKVAKDNVDKVNKMPAKSIVEGGKIYLAKEDGTKLDSGTELPAGGSTIEVVNNLESDSTTAALSAAQGKALNTQYKDIAKKTVIENNKLYLVDKDNNKVDQGTELPSTSGVTDEQIQSAVNSYLIENPIEVSSTTETYKIEDIGELYFAPSKYTAWCPSNLKFDKTLDKFVVLLYCATAHIHSTSDLYISYIDKESFVATQPVKAKYVDTDGVTDITPSQAGTTSFMILDDGTYMMLHDINRITYRFISNDNGLTWVKKEVVVGFSGSPWGLTKLANGRLICSDDVSKVGLYYSDDMGINWTQVVPTSCGGNYEAEAFILELEENKLIAIARKNMDGAGYDNDGDSNHAIISYSTDNGITWSDWVESNTIDNMNGSSCTGLIHDGVVEIFACSRWYNRSGHTNTDNTNTGKNGAMMHYIATTQNALNDNFTKVGILDYARGESEEYHSPCVAADDRKNILIVHMDGGGETDCNHRYLRGELGGLSYLAKNGSNSTVKAYSANYTEILFQNMLEKINTLQSALSRIEGSGVDAPTGALVWTKTWDTSTGITPTDTNSQLKDYIYKQYAPKIKTDSEGKSYVFYEGFSFLVFEASKVNGAIEITSTKATSYGTFIGFIVKGEFIGIDPSEGKHKYKVINNNGNVKGYVDDKDSKVSPVTLPTDSLDIVKKYLGITDFDTTKTYFYVRASQTDTNYYAIKIGEWD